MVEYAFFSVIRFADTPGGAFCDSSRGRVTSPVEINDLSDCFGIFNDDNEVDRRISGGVCVDTRFIKESVVVGDEDFFLLSERGDFDRDLLSSSLDSTVKLIEGDPRSNPNVLLDTLINKNYVFHKNNRV
jgi:hypothetical protein